MDVEPLSINLIICLQDSLDRRGNDFLNDVGLDDGIPHHDFIHEIYDGRGRLLWF